LGVVNGDGEAAVRPGWKECYMPGICKILVLVSLLAISLSHGTALAQESDEAAKPVNQSRSSRVTAEQLQAFADLTGDSPQTISLRLSRDANLGPLIVSAAEARKSRKGTGLVMAIVGFTILGVGEAVGSYIMYTTPGYPNIEGHEGQFYKGAAIGLGSLAVGLALGIPGIVKMAAPGEEETAALDYYAPNRADSSTSRHVAAAMAPGTLMVPLFSGTF
jgi:hypothetical protein